MDLTVFLLWIHLAAIVTWVGLWFNTLLAFMPLRKHLAESAGPDFVGDYQKHYAIITWSSMAVFIITGTILMLGDENYPGLGKFFESGWATLIFTKHIVVILMIALSMLLLYGILPKLRAALIANDRASADRLWKRERLAVVSLAFLGLAVLFIIMTVMELPGHEETAWLTLGTSQF